MSRVPVPGSVSCSMPTKLAARLRDMRWKRINPSLVSFVIVSSSSWDSVASIYHDCRNLSVSSTLEAAMSPNAAGEVFFAYESRPLE